MPNVEIKKQIKSAGVFQYQIAELLGVSEMTFIRWLRKELTAEKREAILHAIKELKAGE